MKKDTLYTANKYNMGLFANSSEESQTFSNGGILFAPESKEERKRKKDTLETVNKWNKNKWNKSVTISSDKGNIFAFAGPLDSSPQGSTSFYNFEHLQNNNINGFSGKSVSGIGNVQTTGLGNTNFADKSYANVGSGINKEGMSALTSQMGGDGGGFGGGKAMGNAAWLQAIPGALNGWTVALQEDPQYSSDAHNGFSLVDSTLTQGKKTKVGMGLVNTGASIMNKGLESGNGVMALVGGIAGTVGTIINNGWGYKVDREKLQGIEEGIERNKRFVSNAGSFDAIKGPTATMTNTDVYTGGVFTKGSAREKNEELQRRLADSRNFAYNSVSNNIFNLRDDQLNNALANFSAFGGFIKKKKRK